MRQVKQRVEPRTTSRAKLSYREIGRRVMAKHREAMAILAGHEQDEHTEQANAAETVRQA